MKSRSLAVVALAATTLTVLSGCTLFGTVIKPDPVNSSTNEEVDPALAEFYHQSLDWSNCVADMQCATAKAPIDWEQPELGSIDLALIRHQATGTKQGSLMVNPGGPGGSGWDFVAYSSFPGLDKDFDIVGWDPRGVGQSTSVVCYTDDAARDESLYGTFDSGYDTEGWIDELTTSQEDYAKACLDNTGDLLGNVDTVSTARDLDLIRAILGDAKLNYLGYSYGTKIGYTYAELFPEKVGRMVLDGAVDPRVSDFEALKTQMAGFESAFRAYTQFCLDGDGCPFTGSLDDALSQARGILDVIDAQQLVNGDGRVLDSATVGTAIAVNLYSDGYWSDISAMFADLKAGDPASAFINADRYNSRYSDGSYAGNSVDVYQVVTCLDGDFLKDDASTLQRVAEIDAAAPTIGKFFTYDDYAVLDVLCTHFPVPVAEHPDVYDAQGAPPILVIGTSNDPATPYASSVSLANELASGVLISYEGEGHTIYNQGVACVDDAVNAYFTKGTVPSVDPMC